MKIYLKETKKEVTFGDVIVTKEAFTHEYFGKVEYTYEVTLTKENLQYFIDAGILYIEKEDSDKVTDYNELRNIIFTRMAKRYDWDENRLNRILKVLDSVHPSASVQMVLKEIAIMLDEKYPGHISRCENLYVISMGDGNIYPIKKDGIKSFRNIAVFRTVKDAEKAKKILGNKLTDLF